MFEVWGTCTSVVWRCFIWRYSCVGSYLVCRHKSLIRNLQSGLAVSNAQYSRQSIVLTVSVHSGVRLTIQVVCACVVLQGVARYIIVKTSVVLPPSVAVFCVLFCTF